jgi:NADPH:quinone reductase-like Zn-dependent oxidoreductase
MKAVIQERFGPPDVLRLADIDRPEVGAGDVLVRVHAAALNPQDFTDRRAHYDVILDNVGNRPLSQLRRALAPTGTLVLNAGASPGHLVGAVGSTLTAVVVNSFVRQRLRPLPPGQKRADLLTITGLIEAGKLAPVLDRTYPLADTAEGLRRVEAGHARGKVVIAVA